MLVGIFCNKQLEKDFFCFHHELKTTFLCLKIIMEHNLKTIRKGGAVQSF